MSKPVFDNHQYVWIYFRLLMINIVPSFFKIINTIFDLNNFYYIRWPLWIFFHIHRQVNNWVDLDYASVVPINAILPSRLVSHIPFNVKLFLFDFVVVFLVTLETGVLLKISWNCLMRIVWHTIVSVFLLNIICVLVICHWTIWDIRGKKVFFEYALIEEIEPITLKLLRIFLSCQLCYIEKCYRLLCWYKHPLTANWILLLFHSFKHIKHCMWMYRIKLQVMIVK